ncbi:LacI family transcriptional regulator [Actinomycetota bacterium]|nr:LacI family transcriptional regulator [Actinomycetota bacterium]
MASLKDIADKAGVSIASVSRVLNNSGYISQKTHTRVKRAIQKLNSESSSTAIAPQGTRAKVIGIIFPNVSTPFFGELTERLEKILFTRGYHVLICNSDDSDLKEREYLNMLTNSSVDGIISSTHNDSIEEYNQNQMPIVSFDRFLSKTIPTVSSDNYQGGCLAAKALLDTGVKKPAVITGFSAYFKTTLGRVNGFSDTFKEFGIDVLSYTATEQNALLKSERLLQLLKEGVADSYFCNDDTTAFMLIAQAMKIGIRIPEDIKVIGYDGTAIMRQCFPSLTTVVQPIEELALLIVELLVARIKNPNVRQNKLYTLPVTLHKGTTA